MSVLENGNKLTSLPPSADMQANHRMSVQAVYKPLNIKQMKAIIFLSQFLLHNIV